MKKKRKILIPVIIVSSILLLLVAAFLIIAANGLSVTSGRVLITRDGRYIITGGRIGPDIMTNLTKSKNLFDKLTDGDKILIIHGAIAQSYPGHIGIYFCMKIGNGEITDINESTLKKLTEMGLITYDENKNEPSESLPEISETACVDGNLDQSASNYTRNELKYGIISGNEMVISENADSSIPVLSLPASYAKDFPVAGYNITSFTAYTGKNWLVILSDAALGSQHIRIIVKGSDKEWHIIGDADSVGCREVVSGAGFADEKTGFLSYRYLEADDLKIRRTTDGGINWEWVVIDVPDKYSSYKKTPLSPVFLSNEWLYPIALYDETGYVKTTWLRSVNRGQTWEFAGDLTVY